MTFFGKNSLVLNVNCISLYFISSETNEDAPQLYNDNKPNIQVHCTLFFE